jgi:anti-sigma factor RsiW
MTYPIGMTCQQLVELVTDYLEDAMAPGERARFETHLAVCPGCVDYLEQMRATIRATGQLTEESVDPSVRDQLLSLFRDWKRPA